jgi:integrase
MNKLLTDKEVRAIKDAGRYLIAPNLFLVVSDSGSRSYHARISLATGKRSWRSLGLSTDMTVKEARTKALHLTESKMQESITYRTFGIAFEEYIEMNRSSWKNESSERQWRQSFKDYINPKIGSLKIEEIKPFHIADLLKPIWTTKSETARRVRGRIELVIDYELARIGVLAINPAQSRFIGNLLPKQKVGETHLEAPTVEELRTLYQSLGDSVSHLALKWTIEHACRTTETREATHDEINENIWTIPAERMKASREHRSPIVGVIPERKGKSNLLFPNGDEPLSINGMRSILQKRKIKWTVHGVRSCFRSWCQEVGVSDRVAEQQLAHIDTNAVQRAYARSDLLEERRAVLVKWVEVLNEKE